MPRAHRAHAEWTPSRLIAWAAQTGPATGRLVAGILERRPHPEQGYRACLGLMRLGRLHGADCLDAACARAERLRSVVELPAPRDAAGRVTVTYDLTRLQRLDTDTHYLVTLGGTELVDPAKIIETMEYAHPIYTPESVAAQRRLPEIETSRLAFAGAYHGWGFHEDGARSGLAAAERLGFSWPQPTAGPAVARARPPSRSSTAPRSGTSAGSRSGTGSPTARTAGWSTSMPCPRRGVPASFEARDHLGSPDRSIRENVDAFLATRGIDLDGGRVLMLANPRALGYCFNPISVFWCHHRSGELAGVVLEVHNTYGDRHAYLVQTDEHGRAEVDKTMYVSPFHDVAGRYEVHAPVPGETATVSITLHHAEGPAFSASLVGEPLTGRPPLRAALSPILGSARIRLQGIGLWLRRLPGPPPSPPSTTGGCPVTTLASTPTDIDRWPGLHVAPSGPRARVAAGIARKIFQVATARLGIAVIVPNRDDWSIDLDSAAVRGAGTNAPTIVLHRPDEFFRRIGNDGLIGFGEAFQTGSWSSPDLGHLLTVMAGEISHPRAAVDADDAGAVRRPGTADPPQHGRPDPRQHRGPLRPVQRPVRHVPGPDAELLLGTVRVPGRDARRLAEAKAPTGIGVLDLEEAQGRKIERLLDEAGVGAHTRVLEIGTGWGELAIRAARRGATVVSVTLSSEQKALADERIAAAGFADAVDVQLKDYRQASGTYDAVLSVEMVEAVGHEYWQTYFEKIDSLLAPGGKVAIQAITMPHDRMLATKTPTRGSTSTSSPAASCRRCGRSRRSRPGTPRCG